MEVVCMSVCVHILCVCVQSCPQVSVGICVCVSVGLVGRKQSGVHRLHAGGAGEGSHQPVVYTVHVVNVHAGQEPDGVTIHKVHHTDDTPVKVNTDSNYHKLNTTFCLGLVMDSTKIHM